MAIAGVVAARHSLGYTSCLALSQAKAPNVFSPLRQRIKLRYHPRCRCCPFRSPRCLRVLRPSPGPPQQPGLYPPSLLRSLYKTSKVEQQHPPGSTSQSPARGHRCPSRTAPPARHRRRHGHRYEMTDSSYFFDNGTRSLRCCFQRALANRGFSLLPPNPQTHNTCCKSTHRAW
jgi:hypothetical protein